METTTKGKIKLFVYGPDGGVYGSSYAGIYRHYIETLENYALNHEGVLCGKRGFSNADSESEIKNCDAVIIYYGAKMNKEKCKYDEDKTFEIIRTAKKYGKWIAAIEHNRPNWVDLVDYVGSDLDRALAIEFAVIASQNKQVETAETEGN